MRGLFIGARLPEGRNRQLFAVFVRVEESEQVGKHHAASSNVRSRPEMAFGNFGRDVFMIVAFVEVCLFQAEPMHQVI